MGKLIRERGGVMSLRAAVRRARELGATVTTNQGTGELRVRFSGLPPVNHNARRKDASRALLLLIRKAEEPAPNGRPSRDGRALRSVLRDGSEESGA
jgi:hypothetical protein